MEGALHPVTAVEGKPGGKTLLVLAGSPMGENSATNTVGKAFCAAYNEKFPDDTIRVLDLASGTLPPFTAARVQLKFKLFGGDPKAVDGDKEWEDTKKLIDEFKAADKYVILSPMWNFGITYHLKLYIDHLVQPGLTFGYDMTGLVTGKPCCVIRAAGGTPVGSEVDTGYQYLQAVLGFIGFTDIRLLGISGTANPAGLKQLLEDKSKEAVELAAEFEFDPAAKIVSNFKAPEVSNPAPAAVKEGAKVLLITSSPMGDNSASLTASKKFLDVLKEKVDVAVETLDLSDGTMEEFTAARVQAKFATWGGGKDAYPEAVKKEWEYTATLIEQFKAADVIVFAVPMWNLSIPYTLKKWIDHIVQPHQTFDPATYAGLVQGKRAFVVAASGNGLMGGPLDHITGYLQKVLGLCGVTDVSFTYVKNHAAAQEAADELTKLAAL